MKEYDNYFQFETLNNLDVLNIFTKKPFNFCSKTNDMNSILENYAKIKNILGSRMQIKKGCQTHSSNIAVITENNINDEFLETDGLITNLKGVGLTTIVADCQAILLYDPVNKVIGNIHSGWKGTLNKILRKAITVMTCEFGSDPKDIIACISPSIGKCCFEVDEDVVILFKNQFDNIDDLITKGDFKDGKQKYYIDTIGINVQEMIQLGFLEKNITLSNICTKCNSNLFHSYRKEHEKSGRNLALICMK